MNLLQAPHSRTTDTIRDYIDRQLFRFGSPSYSYTVIDKNPSRDTLIISSYPDEWVNLYRSSKLQHIDPVVLTASTRISPFPWNGNTSINHEQELSEVFLMAQKYNVVNGFTFVLHDQLNNMALLSLLIDRNAKKGLEYRVFRNVAALQMLLIKTHEKMQILSRDCIRKEDVDRDLFSPRENEVLYWASRGKTYPEIAIIMGVVPRTVKFHMGNIKRKLGAVNARQAIRISTEHKLITLIG